MKNNVFKRIISALMAFVMMVGVIFMSVIPVHAVDVSGTVYAGGVSNNSSLVLKGDTTLVMSQNLTIKSISGEYDLTIQGSGKLTVNGSGNGIDVKSLNCSSDLYIQTGWHAIEVTDTLYIQNSNTFINGGIYTDGNIEIYSNNAIIAGNDNAISSTGGNITLSGSTFDIGANGVAVLAKVGEIYMAGDFTVNSNNGRTIDAYKGAVTIDGSLKSTSGAKFDPDVHFIDRDFYSIGAAGGFNFYGTTLEVEGLGGIRAGIHNTNTDISITADSVSIIAERYYALRGNYIYVDSDELWLENQGSEEDENVEYNFGTIVAQEDVTLYSESGGIVGEYCVSAGENLALNGTFVVGADTDNRSWAALQADGMVEATGALRVLTDNILCIDAVTGFSFDGTTLELEGHQGIVVENGDVNIIAESTEIVVSDAYAIREDLFQNDFNCNVYIDSDYLWVQGEKDTLRNLGCITVDGDVTIRSDEAVIIGNYGVRTDGNITLEGNIVAKGLLQEAIKTEGRVDARGNLSVQTDGEYNCLSAQEFTFEGTTLTANGHAGIGGKIIDVTADSVVATTDNGATLSGDEVYVTANYLWAENKATKSNGSDQYGISAKSKLALNVEGGTVIGYEDALHVYDENDEFEYHYIYVDGNLTVVSKTGAGMYVPQGIAECYGGPIVSVGESHGIYADNVYFEGGSLRVDGTTGIYAASGVELSGDDIKITAFGQRNSGIWCENGYVDLEGKVVINTNGWYGVNAGTDLSFHEGYYEISGPEGNAQAVKVGGELYMDGTLEIVKPTHGHVNGNDIYGAGNSPAMEVLIYSAISNVSLYINPPREGELPTRNASDIYFLDPRCTVEEIVWYEDGVEMLSQDAVFRAGHSYTVKITISADGDYYFLEGVMGKINDKSVSTGTSQKKIIYLTADMGECPKAIRTVELEITAPVEGNRPSTSVTDPSSEYGVYSRNVRWTVSTDGVNFYSMADGEKFEGGKYYRVFMDVNLAGTDYKFPVTTASGSVQPDVISYVNGNPAVTEKAYDQDPETVITVYFDFGKCNDYIIEEIDILDVVAPVAGQHPTYTANTYGTGYHVDTTQNSYYDAYWKNPPEKWYFVKNGISWWDVTDGGYDYVYENEVFLPGHEYECQINVRTDDGYEFVMDLYTNPETWPTATVNGNPAGLTFSSASGLRWEQEICYTFTCEENVVDQIIVDGITAPQKGQSPDYTAILGNPDLYQLDTDYGLNGSGIYWYDCEGRQLEAGERFGDAGPYRIAIKFVPASLENGGYVSQFGDEVEVRINGKSVTPYGDWDDVTVGSGTAWAFYTFRNASAAPELGVTVSGTVTSFKNASGDITLQLCEYNSDTVAYETTVKGNTVDYSFADVAAGVYTLKVSKENHVTREYMVIVNSGSVIQDVKIHLLGDVTGDGRLRSNDLTIAYDHVSGEELITDDYIFRCADIDGNGRIRSNDVTKMYDHTTGDELLW